MVHTMLLRAVKFPSKSPNLPGAEMTGNTSRTSKLETHRGTCASFHEISGNTPGKLQNQGQELLTCKLAA